MPQPQDLHPTREEGQEAGIPAAVPVWVAAVAEEDNDLLLYDRQGISTAGFYLNGSV
jgi:hypothetical protein